MLYEVITDVAAYINSQVRPEKEGLDRDFPDRTRKPVDTPFPPYADDFSVEQHKYGPWNVITSYSIHYTKLYDRSLPGAKIWVAEEPSAGIIGFLTLQPAEASYNFV